MSDATAKDDTTVLVNFQGLQREVHVMLTYKYDNGVTWSRSTSYSQSADWHVHSIRCLRIISPSKAIVLSV